MPAYTNAHTTIPEVFKAIIANDVARVALRDLFVAGNGSTDDWRGLRGLVADRKQNLRPSAERALRWNTDKGAN